ncbi:restriction endonuclease subunit S [Rodentibacter pneumotropicus]|nr:restriction endonuclease subunit S [Rodentibacter pneumotropicus]OOF64977.1 hypothetical protein BKL50_00530 [Rodentibacter pneumotropicus]
MKSYEQYKPSGVAWLGDVPEHWEVKRLKYLLAEKLKYGANESAELDDKDLPRYIRITDIREDGKLKEETFKSLEYEKAEEYLLDNFDILLARSGATVGKSYLYKKSLVGVACYAGYLIRARFKQEISNPEFINYVFQSNFYSAWVKAVNIQATIQNVSAEKYNEFTLALPPLEEQIAIATYLDERTAYLDRLIAKQQALSEKLSEKRTALITEAVCGRFSINTDVESAFLHTLRDSGIQWVGEVPEHWETWKITHLVDFIGSGTTPKSDNPEYYDGEMLWVTTSELRENYISDTKQKVSQEAIKNFSALKIYPKNSVAIAMYGATIGRLGILEKEATFNQACCVFIPSEKLHYKFLFYWLWHRRPVLISLSNGGGQPNLSQDDLKKIKIAIPNYEKQTAIATFLDKETAKIDRLQAKIAESIALLKEYRAALITQVVTGKIKVQGV